MAMKKGSYFFILDAFVGGTIIFFTLILLINVRVVEPVIHTTSFTSADYLQLISGTKVRDFQNPYLSELRLAGDVTDSRATLLEVIVNLQEDGKPSNATEFVGNFTPGITPIQTGISLIIDDSEVFSMKKELLTEAQSISSTKTIVVDSVNYGSHIVEVRAWV